MSVLINKEYILKLLLYMLIITTTFMAIAYVGIDNVYVSSYEEAREKKVLQTSAEMENFSDAISIRFEKIIDMMQSLSYDYEVLNAFDDDDFKSKANVGFEKIITYSDDYLQLRLLNLEGIEILRVDNVDGKPVTIASEDLQDKSDRYYFKEMMELKEDQLYFSPFDLNVENGAVEDPYVPTYRVGKALFKDGIKIGYLIVNYSGNDIFNVFNFHYHSENSGELYLINNEGYYYINEREPSLEWGFMFENGRSIIDDYPDAWLDILDTKKGNFDDEIDGFFNVLHFNPLHFDVKGGLEIILSDHSNYRWILVHRMSPEDLMNLSNFTGAERMNMLVTLFVLSFIVSLFIAERILNSRTYKVKLMKQATIDPLTGILNRSAGLERLNQMVENYAFSDFHLVFLDLDYLKLVNDSLGHDQGDNYIIAFADCVNEQIRDTDLFFRYAGDEFILCFTDSSSITVERIMMRIRDQFLRENPIIIDNTELGFAYGIEEYNPEKHPLIEHWIAQADSKMYRHKTNKKAKLDKG